MSKFNVNEQEKNRIRGLHKNYSLIKEQEGFGTDIMPVDDSKNPRIEPGDEQKPKMGGGAAGPVHVWESCYSPGSLLVPTASGLGTTPSNSMVTNASNAFYSLMGSPSVGTIGFVTAFGGAAGGAMCLKYLGTQSFGMSLQHHPLDLNGGNVQFVQNFQGCDECMNQRYDWNCNNDGDVYFCQNVQWGTGEFSGQNGQQDCNDCINNPNCTECYGGTGQQTEYCQCCDGGFPISMATPVPLGDCGTFNFGGGVTNCQSAPAMGGVISCQQTTHYCIDCVGQTMATYTVPGSCPSGYADLGPTIPAGGACWDCVNQSTCVQGGWNGENTQADCQANCQQMYECVNGQCLPDPAGQYSSMAACTPNCTQSQTWDCNGASFVGDGSCTAVNGSGGAFATEDDCRVSPCACDDVISVWPLYLNNPNYSSGNWSDPAHDGPSNNNAMANQLTNIQNSNAYTSTNPVQLHKALCKEAAINHWMAGGPGNTACCSDPGFAVGAATNDPDGCVAQQWINTMDNFMNQHVNWPGQGCPWLNTALANVTAQQANNATPGSTYWCKTQGKIDFINNFKATGNSSYVQGGAQASFPLPCV
tara:strand:- start:183 stop:1946 length:1764 start_codon:yes stop_codon:yes gene_type:complete